MVHWPSPVLVKATRLKESSTGIKLIVGFQLEIEDFQLKLMCFIIFATRDEMLPIRYNSQGTILGSCPCIHMQRNVAVPSYCRANSRT